MDKLRLWKWILLSVFGGGIAFWIPDIIIPALDKSEQRGLVTLACPAVLMLFYFSVLRLRRSDASGPSTAVFALIGIWILALPFALLAQEVRSRGGIGFSWGELGYVIVSSFMPTRVFYFLVLEGSAIALLIGTAAMIICHVAFERTRRILPPRL